jgi:hypothetical protein
LFEAEDHAGLDDFSQSLLSLALSSGGEGIGAWRWDDGIKAQRGSFEQLSVVLNVIAEFDSEIVEGELIERDAFAEVFQIKNFLAQPEKLLVAIPHILVNQFLHQTLIAAFADDVSFLVALAGGA